MQANTITLPVDVLNDGNPSDKAYSRFQEFTDRSVYNGPSHTVAVPNTMVLYRTLPKRTGVFLGAAKTAIKFTKTVSVLDSEGNSTLKPAIAEASFSIPVGMTPAATLELRQHLVAAVDAAFSTSLVDLLEI